MLIDIPVTADTSIHAGEQAVMLAKAQGFNTAHIRRIAQVSAIDVGDAFDMMSTMRGYTVTVEVTKGFSKV
jgi:hypothetical protein